MYSIDQFCVDADEENPQDIRKGESFAAEVINRVMHGKGWPDTLLIWTYDETPPAFLAPPELPEPALKYGTW